MRHTNIGPLGAPRTVLGRDMDFKSQIIREIGDWYCRLDDGGIGEPIVQDSAICLEKGCDLERPGDRGVIVDEHGLYSIFAMRRPAAPCSAARLRL